MKLTDCLDHITVSAQINSMKASVERLDYDMLEELTMRLIESGIVSIKEKTDGDSIIKTAKLYFLDPKKMDEETREKLNL